MSGALARRWVFFFAEWASELCCSKADGGVGADQRSNVLMVTIPELSSVAVQLSVITKYGTVQLYFETRN